MSEFIVFGVATFAAVAVAVLAVDTRRRWRQTAELWADVEAAWERVAQRQLAARGARRG